MKIRTLLLYGALLGVALTILSLADSAAGTGFLQGSAYGGVVGIVFLLLGLWLGNWGNSKGKQQGEEHLITEAVRVNEARSGSREIPFIDLSEREREVLDCLAEGMSNKEIAMKLFISENTVKTHLQNLYAKLEVSRRTQAVARARDLGIL